MAKSGEGTYRLGEGFLSARFRLWHAFDPTVAE